MQQLQQPVFVFLLAFTVLLVAAQAMASLIVMLWQSVQLWDQILAANVTIAEVLECL